MRRWGLAITVFYAAVVLVLLLPGLFVLFIKRPPALGEALEIYRLWWTWLYAGILAGGAALLLFLSVDTSWRRLKPRQHIAVTALLAAFFAALLAVSAIWSLAVGIFGDKALDWYLADKGNLVAFAPTLGWLVGLWAAWGVVFLLYARGAPEPVAAIVSWLLKGSILELLIAVPAHIIVRHRDQCSAPVVTGWGIVTGLAIMLLCFGPGVLALYKKRLDASSRKLEERP